MRLCNLGFWALVIASTTRSRTLPVSFSQPTFCLVPSVMYNRSLLFELLKTKALRFGKVTLASGKEADYYLDCKQVTLDAAGLFQVGQGLYELIASQLPAAVGGMAIGADPITAAVLCAAAMRQMADSRQRGEGSPALPQLKGFMVRKEAKGHGMQKYLEGPVAPGDEVVIVEDVVTTGGSSLLAIDRCLEFGLKVRGVLAIVDRMEGGKKNFADRGFPLQSLFTIEDFGLPAPQA